MGILANLALGVMLLQYGRPTGPRQATAVPGNGNPDAVATFNGTFKSADKKFLTIEVEDDQTMRMYITGSTRFFRDGKTVKASDFHSGESVTVDASRDARMNLLAVRVEAAKPPKAPEK
jgi:hypothetical protein